MMAVHWWRVIGSGRSTAFKEISPSTLDTRRFLQQPTNEANSSQPKPQVFLRKLLEKLPRGGLGLYSLITDQTLVA